MTTQTILAPWKPVEDLAETIQRAQLLEQRPISARTRAAYKSDWDGWVAWCAKTEMEPWPVHPSTLHTYLRVLADYGTKISTMERKVAALRVVSELGGMPLQTKRTRTVLKNLRRETVWRGVKKASAMMDRDLRAILQNLPQTPQGHRDRAILLVGWCALLRASDLVGLRLEDVAFVEDGVCLHLAGISKTDKDGLKQETARAGFGRTVETCPVRSLKTWIAVRGDAPGALFPAMTRHGTVHGGVAHHMRRDAIPHLIRKWAAVAGVSATHWSGHSLRRGGATTAFRDGADLHSIQAAARHASPQQTVAYIDKDQIPAVIPTAGIL